MNTITAHPTTNEQTEALKAVMKALKIKFKVVRGTEYDPAFVDKITESRKQVSKGRVTRVAKKDLEKLLGLP